MERSTENKNLKEKEPSKNREGLSAEKGSNKGYKKTIIGWIPEDWEVDKLKEVIHLISGQHLDTDQYSDNSHETPYFTGPTDVTSKMSEVKKFSSQLNKFANYGDVIITVKGSGVGTLFILKLPKVILGRQLMAIDSNMINKPFCYYYLFTKQSRLKALSSGNMIPGLSRNDILSLSIPIPPLPEQRKIAEIFSTWDKAIEHTQNLIAQLKLRKKGLMQQLLSGKTRLKGFSGEWKEVQLKDIANRLTTKNGELNDNVVTISAQRGFVKQEDFFKKRVASDTLSGYYLIKRGQFAYNKSYSNGYPMGAFKRLDNLDKAVVTTLYICFNLKNNVDSDFLVNFFEAGLMVRNLMKIAQEGGRAHGLLNIALNDFFSLKMTIPEIEEQQAIAKVLTTADNEIKKQEAYLAQLQAQKKGLMQKLLTGEVRVKVK
ncbi:restriction endonuclease subunit S [Saccharicrinis sp. FJH62]|uniref:restriction endonuclease subunit S n=1 Tax=Saccharicrinis sp. FJH62 TaxID=3344657 RepID=UPI0035D52453